jgi:hypothetical protein
MTKLLRSIYGFGLALIALTILTPTVSFADNRPDLVIAVNKLPRTL